MLLNRFDELRLIIIKLIDKQKEMEIKLQTASMFEEGIALYYSKEFGEAQRVFSQCIKNDLKDLALNMYMKRCLHYIEHGWDDNWDGINLLDGK